MIRKFAILGLGIFGSTLVDTLSIYNVDIIAVDKDMDRVEAMAPKVLRANMADMTDKEALAEVGVGACDVAIITVGDELEPAILGVMNARELGVPCVIAKANNDVNATILEKVGAHKVILPQKEMATRLAKSLLSSSVLDILELDESHSIVELAAPESWWGKSLIDLDLRNQFHINVLGIKRAMDDDMDTSFNGHTTIEKDNILVVFTRTSLAEDFDQLV